MIQFANVKRQAWLLLLFLAAEWGLNRLWGGQWQVSYFLRAAVCRLLFLGLVLLPSRKNWERELLSASVLLSATVLAGNFGTSLASLLLLLGFYLADPNPGQVLGEGPGQLAGCLGLAFAAAAVLWLSRRLFGLFEGERPKKWYVLLAIPLLGIVAMVDMANWGASHGILLRSGGWLGICKDELLSFGGMCILTALSMLGAGVYLFGMERMELELRKGRQYQQQLEAYQRREEQQRQRERLSHDMQNHILALTGLAKEQEWEKLMAYLGHMAGSISLGGSREATGNQAVDALLEQKGELARGQGISWDCQAQIPKGSRIRDIDWCILLGNLLDNAINACGRIPKEEETLIRLRAGRVKGCFLLEVKNTVNPQEGSTKRPVGIGLMNVRDMVEHYGGTLEAGGKENIYMVSVLVPLEPAEPGQDIKPPV